VASLYQGLSVTIDFSGIAAIIGAAGTFIAIITTAILQVITFMDIRHEKKMSAQERQNAMRREQKIDTIANNVNGINTATTALAIRTGTAEGIIEGIAQERKNGGKT
jgi:hypothetical protein